VRDFFAKTVCCFFLLGVHAAQPSQAAEITNPGFENGWTGWMDVDKDGNSTAISGDSHSGDKSAKITGQAGSFAQVKTIRLAEGGLSPDLPPGRNFELIDWYLNTPEDGGDGRCKRVSEQELAAGYQDEYFYTADDGGMVFKVTVDGARTSQNTRYTRTELREMLRRGDTSISTTGKSGDYRNNWVFSSAPAKAQKRAGAVDGILRATLAVNHVTTTGAANEIGLVVIGQIHASSDEPIRLHYRKLPHNKRGSIFAAHEISGGDDLWYEILGSLSDTAQDPVDGIALDEKFSYEINARGNELKVTISQRGVILGRTTIDMSESGYDVEDDYMYFKAGAYTQNHTGDPEDYDQVTFYALENKHDGYDH